MQTSPSDAVHPVLRVAAEWTWRVLVLLAGLIAVGYVVGRLSTVVIPFALALLSAGLLAPIVSFLMRLRLGKTLSVIIALLTSLGLLAGVFTFIVQKFIAELPELTNEITNTIDTARSWLAEGPFHLSDDRINQAAETLTQAIKNNQAELTEGAFSTASAIGHFLAGFLLTIFILIFLLHGGREIWEFVTRIVPTPHRARVRIAGIQGFGSLVGFMRATMVVALVDAISIGAGLAILGVPLWLPLASLVFLGGFIPIVGAFLAGFIAVMIALMTKGLVTALIVLAIIVAVMQIEGHVLHPILLGRAVQIHPLAVVLAITSGVVLAGVAGGLFAVPLVAVLNTGVRSLLGDHPGEITDETKPEQLDGSTILAPEEVEAQQDAQAEAKAAAEKPG